MFLACAVRVSVAVSHTYIHAQVTKDVILQQAIQAFRADFQAAMQRTQVRGRGRMRCVCVCVLGRAKCGQRMAVCRLVEPRSVCCRAKKSAQGGTWAHVCHVTLPLRGPAC